MWKKLKIKNDDLLGNDLLSPQGLLLNVPIDEKFNDGTSGNVSFFKKKDIIIWEGCFQTDSGWIVSYYPTIKPSYFYLLSFESSKNLNTRSLLIYLLMLIY